MWIGRKSHLQLIIGHQGQEVNLDDHYNSKLAISEMTTQDITKTVLVMQDKTQESTARSKKLVQETIDVLVFLFKNS